MSKYIDADKLIKTVNRYRDNAKAAFNPIEDDADYYKGKIDACEDIQEFIISLQQEQPEVDLEKEFQEYWYLHQYDQRLRRQVMDGHGKAVLRNVAGHFYELGRLSQI